MKLRLNLETGAVVPYTINDDPIGIGRTEMCRPIDGKVNTSLTGEAGKERVASAGEESTAKFQTQHHVAAEREAAIRGQKMRRDNVADLPLHEDNHLEQQQVEGDSFLDNGKPRQFRKGQDVFVSSGKAQHPAIIVSIQSGMATVLYTTGNVIGSVEMKQLLSMSSFTKRKRTEAVRFTPPALPMKKTKVQEMPKGEDLRGLKGQRGSRKAPVVAKKTKANKDSDFIRETLDYHAHVPSGVAPGPGWKSYLGVGKDNSKRTRWISPGKGFVFGFSKVAFEFEQLRQQCNGDELQALELYKKQRKAAGKKYYIRNSKSNEESSGSVRENLNCCTNVPPGVAPGPGWKSLQVRACGKSRTHWISPSKRFVFNTRMAASKFENIRQDCSGDEMQALELYKQQSRAAGKQICIINTKANKEGSASVQENLDCCTNVPRGVSPGPGWKSLKVRACGRSSTRWISPSEGLVFQFPRVAFEFEKSRQQCNGDEVQALELYKQERKAAGKKHFVMNDFQSRNVARGEATNETPASDKSLSMESESNAEREEDTESLDSKENTTTSDIESQSIMFEPSAEMEEDTESLDSNKDVTYSEMEYRTLWDCYLKPTTRENEELAGGIVLRRKTASCNLLRCKNSVFRPKVHGKILHLERLGKKDEIYRILKDLSDYDKTMKSADGPYQLMAEILGQQKVDDEVELLDASAVAASQDGYGKNEIHCESLIESINNMAERNDMGDIEDQIIKSPGTSTNLDQSAGNPSMPVDNVYPPPAISWHRDSNDTGEVDADDMSCVSLIANEFMNDEFIDLCEDSDLDQLSLLPDPPPAFVGHKASTNTTEEELNDMDSVSLLVQEFIESEIADLRKDDDLDQVSLVSDPIHLQQAGQSILQECKGGQVSSPSEMHRDLIDLFEDDDLDEVPINTQLVDEPSHQKQTVQDVLQEWADGETTMSSPIVSPTRETDHVDTSVGSDEQMSKYDIPEKVSLDSATEDPDSFNIRATNDEVAGNEHIPQEAEAGGTGSPPKIRKDVIDLCDDDDDDDDDCNQIIMPTLSEIAQERDNRRLIHHGEVREGLTIWRVRL